MKNTSSIIIGLAISLIIAVAYIALYLFSQPQIESEIHTDIIDPAVFSQELKLLDNKIKYGNLPIIIDQETGRDNPFNAL